MQQQQPLYTAQGQQMPQAPAVITSKDLLYLTDMMSWNLIALKKAHFFASQCQIQEISQALEKVCQMHQRHYKQILAHMEKHTNQAPQPPSQMQQQQMQQNQMQ
ncbi:hypothetical protein [Fredinandcohnia quinoae]|uniref:Spore coat protein n=1 Tax=Fredinandcohnia quinoae TaxID=2918902 RepID=A0AAW5E6R7_9BACI|nr:hypothetical protein [Fredinandcohnia sp. SECRCQ15]MCH1625582.1 hypothetical protein [Fredinandcohnia sp. SECRCQ15]